MLSPKQIFQPSVFWLTAFGLGFLRPAPGTWGSVWLALIFAPQVWWLALLAFGLFRFFDIAKPGVVGWLDANVHSGLGVMADDMMAGLISAGIVWLVLQI